MAPELKRSNERILDALRAARGNQRHASSALGCGPNYVSGRLARDPVLAVAWGRLQDEMRAAGELETRCEQMQVSRQTRRPDGDRPGVPELVATRRFGCMGQQTVDGNPTTALARIGALLQSVESDNVGETLMAIAREAARGYDVWWRRAINWPDSEEPEEDEAAPPEAL